MTEKNRLGRVYEMAVPAFRAILVLVVILSVYLFWRVNDTNTEIRTNIATSEHKLCDYFYKEATSPVTPTKTSAFGVTDIVNARYTVLQLHCVKSLPPPSPELVQLAYEFHIVIPPPPTGVTP